MSALLISKHETLAFQETKPPQNTRELTLDPEGCHLRAWVVGCREDQGALTPGPAKKPGSASRFPR